MPHFAQLDAQGVVTRIVTREAKPGGKGWKPAADDTCLGHVFDGEGFAPAPRHPDHATALKEAVSAVWAGFDAALGGFIGTVSAWEFATWPGKLAAARAWEANRADGEDHARLDSVGVPRGLDRAGAAALVLRKAGRMQAAADRAEAIRVAALAALEAVANGQPLAAYIAALDAAVAGVDWTLEG